jgi:hypothetical protein
MDDETKTLLADLVEGILYLNDQLNQSVLNETALIATLKELVPGFGPKFDLWHMKAQKTLLRPDAKTLEALRKAKKYLIQ